MTRDEFIDGYCEKSGITRRLFFENGDAVPCDCGEDGCTGWQYDTARSGYQPVTNGRINFYQESRDFGSLILSVQSGVVAHFKPDGTIEMGDGYTPTEAAEAFIAALRGMLPTSNAVSYLKEHPEALGAVMAEFGLMHDDIALEQQARAEKAERERDEARAERDALGRRIEQIQSALNETGAGYVGQTEVTRVIALRSRIAKLEAVVEAARRQRKWIDCLCRSDGSEDDRARGYLNALGALRHWFDEQLRALDAQDSPVGVAATACAHRRQRFENDHAVCRDCGAFNRAITGIEDWVPVSALDEENSGGSGAAQVAGAASRDPDSAPEPAGNSQGPLAALKAAMGRPLTGEDRKRIAAAAQPERPRGGLLPEPWERGRRGDYVTRAELVAALRAAAQSMPNPASGVALERTATILAAKQESASTQQKKSKR